MMRTINVLLLCNHLNYGGIGTYILNLAGLLRGQGVVAHVASAGGDLVPRLEERGIRHYRMPVKVKCDFHPALAVSFALLSRIVRAKNIDLIHANSRATQVLAAAARGLIRTPFVSTYHGFYKHRRFSRRLIKAWGDAVIAIGTQVQSSLVSECRMDPARIQVIHNGIDTEHFGFRDSGSALTRESLGLANRDIVGALGRLSPVKGYRYLIRAMREVRKRHPRAVLLIVGDGPEKALLEREATESGLADAIRIVAPAFDTAYYYRLFDVFCAPSIQEGLGLSILEAMASGTACIASAVGGITEIVSDRVNGLLVAPADAGALAEKIIELLDQSALRASLALHAQRFVASNFSAHAMAEQTAAVYRRVLTQRGTA